ncbi:protease Do-like 5, chloroplastic isoform X2 [Cajanus cajan]|uniref:protease Do-like 5, chloroplastic isoform X2 n=1 Tax=Cajanus cajan TaxID=3821 RepID=UPI0010FB259F|nr:protease Do-like 5, chloroplastic isoform X2 [Cajanus cajan]
MALFSLQNNLFPLPMLTAPTPSSTKTFPSVTSRRDVIFGSSLVLLNSTPVSLAQPVPDDDELQQQEDHLVQLFQDTSLSVVFIKDLELTKVPKSSSKVDMLNEDEDAKLEGTGSGFIWDKFGHIVFLVDAKGNSFYREGKIIGFDQAYDLAVLKVDVDGYDIKPVVLGQSNNLRVGQSCFAIGNPYGYENTLTTGVVSGLGREIPSPNGRAIRGAIQTDATINAGNSGGPLIDSYGHVIGVNTATFTRKGTGVSSGVNFAIPIDTVIRTVPYLIVYGTPYSNRF